MLRKEASPLGVMLHALGLAGAGHVGTNAAGIAAHKGSNIAEVLAHKGMQHGLLEQKINPIRKQIMKMMLGPEALVPYELANEAGKKLVTRFPNPSERQIVLQSMLDGYHASGLTAHAPGVGALASAAAHEVAGTAPDLKGSGIASSIYGKLVNSLSNQVQTGMETPTQKVFGALAGAAPAVPMLAADAAAGHGIPFGALGHFGWNGIRQGAGATSTGEQWVGDQIAKGIKGQPMSKAKELAMSLAFSPAAVEPHHVGATLRALPSAEKGFQALDQFVKSPATQGAAYGASKTPQGKQVLESLQASPMGRIAKHTGKSLGWI